MTVPSNPTSANNGLWSLTFGTTATDSGSYTRYAFAGINNEAAGLIVAINPVPEPSSAGLAGIGGAFAFAVARHSRASNRG